MTSTISSGSFDEVPSVEFSLHHLPSQCQPVMLLQPGLGSNAESPCNREQPRLPVAMSSPIERNGFEPQIDRREVSNCRDAALAQKRRSEQPIKPGCVLKDRDLVPACRSIDINQVYFVSSIASTSTPTSNSQIGTPASLPMLAGSISEKKRPWPQEVSEFLPRNRPRGEPASLAIYVAHAFSCLPRPSPDRFIRTELYIPAKRVPIDRDRPGH